MRQRAPSLLKCSHLLAAGCTSAKFSKVSCGTLVGARNDIMLMLHTQVRWDTKCCGPPQQPFKGSSVHTHSTKISDSSSTSCSFPSCFVENAMLVFFFEARSLVARHWVDDSAPTKVENWHDPRRAVLATNARYLDDSRVVLGTI